ncbi:MAG: universal stress protein [Planctomycetes bacterium]|nr:universal stress protein [Planctomycetota bacterium]
MMQSMEAQVMGYSKILAAVGIDAGSENAILQADARARAAQGELYVCHAIPNALGGYPFFYPSSGEFHVEGAETRQRLLAELSKYVERLTGRKPGEYRVDIKQGRSHEVILKIAEAWSADLIVLGVTTDPDKSTSDPDLRHILRHAEAPVLVAREREGTKRILVGTDFSDPSLPAVAAAAHEARRTQGEVTILHSIELSVAMPAWSALGPVAVDLPAQVLDDLKADVDKRLIDALKQHGIDGARRVMNGSPSQALLTAAEELRADLVVVGTLGRTGIPRMLIGSVAEEVALSAPCSVLVVRLT